MKYALVFSTVKQMRDGMHRVMAATKGDRAKLRRAVLDFSYAGGLL